MISDPFKVVGIIGGLGPKATCDFMQKNHQEHTDNL